MTIITDNYEPYDFVSRYETLKYIVSRAHDIKKSIRLIEKDSVHLTIRCPLSGDYLDILGTEEDLVWLDEQLARQKWYRTT